jgi:hypothetical protein
MKLSNARVIELVRGIGTLDAGYEVTVDGKNARRPFKYGALVHFPLQRNAAALKPLMEAFNKANAALFAQYVEYYTSEKGDALQRVPADKLEAYREETERLTELVVEVKLFRIKLSDLKVGTGDAENPIPVQAITDLRPILLDDAPADQFVEVPDTE